MLKMPTLIRERFCAAAVLLALLACTIEAGGAAEAEAFHARIDGHDWRATRTLATPTRIAAAGALNLNAFLDGAVVDGKPSSRFGFNLVVSAEGRLVGAYPLGQGALKGSHGSFVANADAGGDPLSDNFRFVDGNVTIERQDEAGKHIWGSFSGHAKNSAGKTVVVTDGTFAAIEISSQAGR